MRWRDEVWPSHELDNWLAGNDLDEETIFDEPEPAGVIDVPFSVGPR